MERPCPEYFNGVKYNTTRECPWDPPLRAKPPGFPEGGLGGSEGSEASVEDVRAKAWSQRQR